MITPFPTVSFNAKLKDGKLVKVQFAQEGKKVFAAMYFISIDVSEPMLFDLRKSVEPNAKKALEDELMQHTDKRFRTGTVKRILSDVTTDFILKNKSEQP